MLVPLVSADALEVGQRVPIALAVLDGVLSVPCGAASGVCASQACDVPALLSACNNSAALARTALATPLPAAAPSDWHAHVHWQPVAVAMPSTGLAAGPVAVLATAALGVLASPLHAVRMPVQRAIESGRIYSAPKRAASAVPVHGAMGRECWRGPAALRPSASGTRVRHSRRASEPGAGRAAGGRPSAPTASTGAPPGRDEDEGSRSRAGWSVVSGG